jgi:hypothetical protein
MGSNFREFLVGFGEELGGFLGWRFGGLVRESGFVCGFFGVGRTSFMEGKEFI